ncbi:family taurine [Moniliophthora roreri MCA 2997]|uniref:Family taurine n=2 Tax=Moniliophthora roreri TaxID=221103 RepID=V2WRZ6_MONRO|nr:family taurine [Moniliophthora roreri MCA 2997]
MVAAPVNSPFSSAPVLGSLNVYESYDNTPHIGTSFPAVQLSELLKHPDSDVLLKDLAHLVSYRGVVFFRDQDITIDKQLELGERLGRLSGKPATSTLHKHPISEDTPELSAEVSVISSIGGIARSGNRRSLRASEGWHADITFENVPSDYAILKIHTLPETGGDTLWASGYEAYDRLSPAFQKFLEGLTAVHNADFFNVYAEKHGLRIQDPRGSPENTGSNLTAVHPVIRTNPVTGFKTLFVNKTFTKHILELTPDESDDVLDYLARHISDNHDLQVRFKWNKNDVAIWDNRVTFHTATNDYEAHRQGNRVVSIGERPYLDPKSSSRRAALGAKPAVSI